MSPAGLTSEVSLDERRLLFSATVGLWADGGASMLPPSSGQTEGDLR